MSEISFKNRRWRWGAEALLLVVALLLRTIRALQEPMVNPDAIRFIAQAQMIPKNLIAALRGEVYHPLHSAAILGVHSLLGHFFTDTRSGWLVSAQTVGVICGALVAMEILALARLFGAPFWAAAAAALVWVVGRRTSAYGADGISDMLFLSLLGASLIVGIHALRFRPRQPLRLPQLLRFAAAGVLSGFSYLTRPEGLAGALIILGTLVLLSLKSAAGPCRPQNRKLLRRRPLSRLNMVKAAAAVLLGVLVIGLPYMLVIGGLTHKKTLTVSLPPTHARLVAPLHQPLSAAALPTLGATKLSWAGIGKIGMELWETFGFAPCLILGLAFLIKPTLWGRARVRPLVFVWLFLWISVMFWLLHKAGYLDGRHTLPLQLVLFSLLGLGFQVWKRPMRWWMDWWRKQPDKWNRLPRWMKWPKWPEAFAGCVVLLALLPGAIRFDLPPEENRNCELKAARWIAAHAPPHAVVGDRELLVGYYSRHPYVRWTGNPAHPRLDQLPPGATCVLARLYRPGEGDMPASAIGPYREVARFDSRVAAHGDLMVVYAIPGTLHAP